MANLKDILINELVRREKLADCLYMLINANRRPLAEIELELVAYVAECSGGAWSAYATIFVSNDKITIDIKTIKGIVYQKFENQKFVFEICEPSFPDNVLEFLRKGAYYANRAYKINREKSWHRHQLVHGPRNVRQRRKRLQERRVEVFSACRY